MPKYTLIYICIFAAATALAEQNQPAAPPSTAATQSNSAPSMMVPAQNVALDRGGPMTSSTIEHSITELTTLSAAQTQLAAPENSSARPLSSRPPESAPLTTALQYFRLQADPKPGLRACRTMLCRQPGITALMKPLDER